MLSAPAPPRTATSMSLRRPPSAEAIRPPVRRKLSVAGDGIGFMTDPLSNIFSNALGNAAPMRYKSNVRSIEHVFVSVTKPAVEGVAL